MELQERSWRLMITWAGCAGHWLPTAAVRCIACWDRRQCVSGISWDGAGKVHERQVRDEEEERDRLLRWLGVKVLQPAI